MFNKGVAYEIQRIFCDNFSVRLVFIPGLACFTMGKTWRHGWCLSWHRAGNQCNFIHGKTRMVRQKSRLKKINRNRLPHKGIAQKLKEGIPLSKSEKTAIGFMQLILTLVQSIEAIVVACGIAGATMALMPIVFNWWLHLRGELCCEFYHGQALSAPSSFVTGMVYVFAGLAPTGFCIIGFAAAICLAGKILFADTSKSVVSFFDADIEENDDKE